MIDKKILAVVLLVSVVIAWVWSTFAYSGTWSTNTGSTNNWYFKDFDWFGRGNHFKWGKFKDNLTDAEKTALATMTDEQKTAFYAKKKEDQKVIMEQEMAKRELKEWVIDTLLAGWTLTPEQQILKTEIIKERADRKIQMEQRKTQMNEIKTIMEKKKNWETLTTEEEAKLSQFKNDKRGWKHWRWR